MENIILLDESNNEFNAELVRYFSTDLGKFLVYTLYEKDENGYVKLYATKLIKPLTAEKIEDDEEWTKFKDLIRVIVHESKDGLVKSIEDLNPADLKQVRVLSFRLFKLADSVVELFGANKKEFKVEEVNTLDDLLGKEQPSYTPLYEELEEQVVPEVSKSEEAQVELPVEDTAAVNEFEMPSVQRTFELPSEDSFELPSFNQSVSEPVAEPVSEPVAELSNEQPEEKEEVQNDQPVVDYEALYLEEKAKNEELMLKLDRIKELL